MVIIYKNPKTDRFYCYEENREDCIVCSSKKDVYKKIEECISRGDEIDMFITSYKYEEVFKKWFHAHNLSPQIGIIYSPEYGVMTPVIFDASKFIGRKYRIISIWPFRWGAKRILEYLDMRETDFESSDCVIYGNKPTWLETVNPDLERAYEIKKDSDKVEIIAEDEFLKSVYPPEDDWPKGFWINNGILFKYTGLDKSIKIPEGVWHINEDAFFDNTYAEEILIPDSVRSIGINAFTGCDELKEITIPDSVVWMDSCFVSCKKLKRVKLSSNIKFLPIRCFKNCKALEEIVIPEGVESISLYAFANCKTLEEIVIPEGVKSIGPYAFENCTALEEIVIPEGVEHISYSAFKNCKALEEVVIPEGVTELNGGAFENCEGLRKIHIPSTLVEISWGVFRGCKNLLDINLHNSIKVIYSDAFDGCSESLSKKLDEFLNNNLQIKEERKAEWKPAWERNMEIYKYINSRDVRKHLQSIKYEFNSVEAAWIVYHCASIKPQTKLRL